MEKILPNINLPENASIIFDEASVVGKSSFRTQEIINYLVSSGFRLHHRGFNYLYRAIVLVSLDKSLLYGVTTRLYPDIAKSFKVSSSKVERAIRYAREHSKEKYKKMTNREFIMTAVINLEKIYEEK